MATDVVGLGAAADMFEACFFSEKEHALEDTSGSEGPGKDSGFKGVLQFNLCCS